MSIQEERDEFEKDLETLARFTQTMQLLKQHALEANRAFFTHAQNLRRITERFMHKHQAFISEDECKKLAMINAQIEAMGVQKEGRTH